MKVKIKKHPTWFGPYQLIDTIFFWAKDSKWVDTLGDKFSESKLGKLWCKLADKWIKFHSKRMYQIKIHSYDTWSMDHTLAPIILPMLIQLKETQHGAPFVELEDVPVHLHPLEPAGEKNHWVDDTHFQRWDWVMNEIIYAFDCKANKDAPYVRIKDLKEIESEQTRISNGFRLFGKYYENLWD